MDQQDVKILPKHHFLDLTLILTKASFLVVYTVIPGYFNEHINEITSHIFGISEGNFS